MTTSVRTIVLMAVLASAALTHASSALSADAEPSDLPEGVVAKMDRLSSKQIKLRDSGRPANGSDDLAHGSSAGKSTPACGSLNVGNVTSSPYGGGPRQVNVLIKGDVINANNKCGR